MHSIRSGGWNGSAPRRRPFSTSAPSAGGPEAMNIVLITEGSGPAAALARWLEPRIRPLAVVEGRDPHDAQEIAKARRASAIVERSRLLTSTPGSDDAPFVSAG